MIRPENTSCSFRLDASVPFVPDEKTSPLVSQSLKSNVVSEDRLERSLCNGAWFLMILSCENIRQYSSAGEMG